MFCLRRVSFGTPQKTRKRRQGDTPWYPRFLRGSPMILALLFNGTRSARRAAFAPLARFCGADYAIFAFTLVCLVAVASSAWWVVTTEVGPCGMLGRESGASLRQNKKREVRNRRGFGAFFATFGACQKWPVGDRTRRRADSPYDEKKKRVRCRSNAPIIFAFSPHGNRKIKHLGENTGKYPQNCRKMWKN